MISPPLLSNIESVLTDISEPEDEQWNEGEEVMSDLVESDTCTKPVSNESEDSEPDDSETTVCSTSHLSFVFANWLTIFFLRIQSVFHLSDKVISLFLNFLRAFLTVVGQFSSICADIAKHIPSSLRKVKDTLLVKPNIKRYVVCRKCHTLYHMQDVITGVGSAQYGKACSFRKFPHHPQRRKRVACGFPLVKTVELAGGKHILYPHMMYCYLSIKQSIQVLFNRPSFHLECEEWRKRKTQSNVYMDIYDGRIWKDFMSYDGKEFLSQPHNLALTMNFDFFQPYKHVSYSIGAFYLTVNNLPRHLRYKQENVILVGLIPGPHEPEHDVNSFIDPLVNELLEFWEGVNLNIDSFGTKCVRCALLCVACDLPAGRKLCGFLSYCARYGCSCCFKSFPGSVGHMDYSGFDRENWPCRSNSGHRQAALPLRNFRTKTEQIELESKSGCRYSSLLKLPYFDAPRMLIVDPMHNLFLGTAKHFLKNIWIERGIINEDNFDLIQKRVNEAMVPSGIGRIPSKFAQVFHPSLPTSGRIG